MATKAKMTRREALVREVKRRHGLSWRDVAKRSGFNSVSGLFSVLQSERPQDATLWRLKSFLERHGVAAELNELANA